MRCDSNKRAGFTLVELLVVITVIAVLISMLLPAVQRAKEMTHRVSCASSHHQWGLAYFAYAHDNHGRLPAKYAGVSTTIALSGYRYNATYDVYDSPLILSNFNQLASQRPRYTYITNDAARKLTCPTVNKSRTVPTWWNSAGTASLVHSYLAHRPLPSDDSTVVTTTRGATRIDDAPTEPLLADGLLFRSSSGAGWFGNHEKFGDSSRWAEAYPSANTVASYRSAFFGLNLLSLDGGVKWRNPDDLTTFGYRYAGGATNFYWWW